MTAIQHGPVGPLVLVVDDDPLIRRFMRDLLEEAGFRIVLASNGQEALVYLASGPPPAVILCDLAMPVMDGREFCERKHADAKLAPIPVIIISGVARMEPDPQALHASALFEKPLPVDRLLSVLHENCEVG